LKEIAQSELIKYTDCIHRVRFLILHCKFSRRGVCNVVYEEYEEEVRNSDEEDNNIKQIIIYTIKL